MNIIDTVRIVCDRVYVTERCPSVCPIIRPARAAAVDAIGPASKRY